MLEFFLESVSVPSSFDETFFSNWQPFVLIGITFIVSVLLTLVVGYLIYTYKKRKLGKQIQDRVAYVTKSMLYGYMFGTVHPTIEDTYQSGNYVTLDDVKCLDCRTTSYLKLDMIPEVKEKAKEMIDRYGTARCVTQMYFKLPLINQLIQKLELITGGHVLIASSVTSGHFAAIPVLVGSNFDSLIVLDRRVHNSVTLATQVCQGNKTVRCNHNDMGHLESILKSNPSHPVWYFCDGIYSMSGAGAPVDKIVQLLRHYPQLHVYVDDAHGTLWAHNAGFFIGELFKLGVSLTEFGPRLIVALALGKCFASGGGAFVFSSSSSSNQVRACGPTLTFNTIVNPSELGSALCITDMALNGQLVDAQARLLDRIQYREKVMHELPLVKSGRMIPTHSISPIAIISFTHSAEAVRRFQDYDHIDGFGWGFFAALVNQRLRQTGYLTNVTAFPAVSLKDAGIRFAVHSEMSHEEIHDMLYAFQSAVEYSDKYILSDECFQHFLKVAITTYQSLNTPLPAILQQATKQKSQ